MIKTVRFYRDALRRLPGPPGSPLLQLLSQVVASVHGVHGADLAEWWLAVGSPGNFSKAMVRLQDGGWISQAVDGAWGPTAATAATCAVLVDEVPEQWPNEADPAFVIRVAEWMQQPPGFVLQ